ncbi:MAG: hypothetical protein ACKOKB_10655 [Bacteroidota bacterium]
MNVTDKLSRIPFLLLLFLFSLPVYLGLSYLQSVMPTKAVFHAFWGIQLLAIGTSWLIHNRLSAAAAVSGQAFVRAFMLTSALKLFAFMVIMVVFALLNREQAFGFIFNFLIVYLLYTVLEVWFSFKSFGPSRKQA